MRTLILGNTLHLDEVRVTHFFVPTFVTQQFALLRYLVIAFFLTAFERFVTTLALIFIIILEIQSEATFSLHFFKLWLFIALGAQRHAYISLIKWGLCKSELEHQLPHNIFLVVQEARNIDS